MNPSQVPGLYSATELNDLRQASAFARYWSKTGNSTYLNQGDDLFSHVPDSAGPAGTPAGNGWTWSVKEFNQIYKWSFDHAALEKRTQSGWFRSGGWCGAGDGESLAMFNPARAVRLDQITPMPYRLEWWLKWQQRSDHLSQHGQPTDRYWHNGDILVQCVRRTRPQPSTDQRSPGFGECGIDPKRRPACSRSRTSDS